MIVWWKEGQFDTASSNVMDKLHHDSLICRLLPALLLVHFVAMERIDRHPASPPQSWDVAQAFWDLGLSVSILHLSCLNEAALVSPEPPWDDSSLSGSRSRLLVQPKPMQQERRWTAWASVAPACTGSFDLQCRLHPNPTGSSRNRTPQSTL